MATVVYERHSISDTPGFSSFVSLWTLSLAPLVVHIVVGVPHEVHLTSSPRPSLLQRLVHWNPTSILWRYFAIFDRRVRAKAWDRTVLASSNALFWTEHGWDGSEAMLRDGRLQLVRMPRLTHIELLSASFPKTLVVAVQGIQALYQMTKLHEFGQNSYAVLPIIFLPLALFGLFRLPAAFWLTEEYAFADVRHEAARRESLARPESSRQPSFASINSYTKDGPFWVASELQPMVSATSERRYSIPSTPRTQYRSLRMPEPTSALSALLPSTFYPLEAIEYPSNQFHSTRNWRGAFVRVLYLSPTLGIVTLAIIYLSMTSDRQLNFSATGLSMIVTYVFFTLITAIIFIINIVRGTTRTNVIPGICSRWYKAYTCILFTMAVAMFVIASLEQIQPLCDGSSTCNDITSLEDFSMTFNASSHQDLWRMKGHMKATSAMIVGKYTGSVNGVDGQGNNFNSSLGAHWVRIGT